MGTSSSTQSDEAQALTRLVEEVSFGDSDWLYVANTVEQQTSAKHMRHYKKTLQINRVFRLRPCEVVEQYIQAASRRGTPKVLFHGTTPTNAQRIILNGFQIPSSPGMFGKGIYFAKDALKSIQYAKKSKRPNEVTATAEEVERSNPTMGDLFKDALSAATNTLGFDNESDASPNIGAVGRSISGTSRRSKSSGSLDTSLWRAAFGDKAATRDEVQHMLMCDVYVGKSRTLRSARPRFDPNTDLRRSTLFRCAGARPYSSVRAPGGTCGAVRITEFVIYDPTLAIPRFLIEFEPIPLNIPTSTRNSL